MIKSNEVWELGLVEDIPDGGKQIEINQRSVEPHYLALATVVFRMEDDETSPKQEFHSRLIANAPRMYHLLKKLAQANKDALTELTERLNVPMIHLGNCDLSAEIESILVDIDTPRKT